MKLSFRSFAVASLALASLALPATADLAKYKDWSKSPEFEYLAVDDERKAWKDVKTDEEAEKFIALFWAKRDPDLKTPVNEFKMEFDARVAQCDKLFQIGNRKRGALTERGKLFILVGPPKTLSRSAGTQAGGATVRPGNETTADSSGAVGIVEYTPEGAAIGESTARFVYEAAQLPKWANVKSLTADFTVTPTSDSLMNAGIVRRLENLAAPAAMLHPELKTPPTFKTREQFEAEQKAAAAQAAIGAELTPGARAALEGVKENAGAMSVIALGYRDGALRLMVQLYVAGASVTKAEDAKLALLVRDKEGKDVARRDEPAQLQKSHNDYFVDRSIPVKDGDHDVVVAILDPAGNLLASGRRAVSVKPVGTTFGSSAVIIAGNDLPVEAPKPDEPFTFSGRRFVSRGGDLDVSDNLSYAMRVYNPHVDSTTHNLLLKRTVKIKPPTGTPVEVPQAPEDPTPAPDAKGGAIVVDLAANIVDTKLSDYNFGPGKYVLMITINDGASELKLDTPFTVTGVLPPRGKK